MKNKNILIIAIVTVCILLIPFVAMQFTDEVNWSLFDFIIAGIFLFGAGLSYELITRKTNITKYKIATGLAVGTALILTWVNLAVGIIGSERNPANLLYIAVLLIGIFGSVIVRFHSEGMSITLFIVAVVQLIIPLVALIFWESALNEPPGFTMIFILNAIFAVLFIISAFLYRYSVDKDSLLLKIDIQKQ